MQAFKRLFYILCSAVVTIFISFGLVYVRSIKANAFTYGSGNYGDCIYSGGTGSNALSFSVSTSTVSLGGVSTSSASTGTATFTAGVDCTNYGYIVTVNGSPPKNSETNYTLDNIGTASLSAPGTEQYGINLAHNTSPSVGSNPSGGSGTAASGYNTANYFQYNSGNTIASTTTSPDSTTYTISYLINASSVTPAGQYSGIQTLICTATY
jgi:hypothetical protein